MWMEKELIHFHKRIDLRTARASFTNIHGCRCRNVLFLPIALAVLRFLHPHFFFLPFIIFLNKVFFQVLYGYRVSAIKVPS